MSQEALEKVEKLADELEPRDQLELISYLALSLKKYFPPKEKPVAQPER